jgi:hypothetical protein
VEGIGPDDPRRPGPGSRPSASSSAGRRSAEVGEALVSFLGALPLAAGLGWLLGVPLSGLALLPAAALASWAAPTGRRVATLVPAALLVAGAVALSVAFLDVSFDGLLYHLPAVRALADGWNPVLDGPLDRGRSGEIFANLYPKGAWASGAVLASTTGKMEAAKALSLVWPLSVFLLAFGTLRPALESRLRAAALAAIVALNPVALLQMFATTADGAVACAVTASLLLAVRLARSWSRETAAAFALGLVALCNVKLSGAAFAFFTGGAALGLAAFQGRRLVLRTAALLGAAAVAGILVAGWNPYVTNALRYGHPAHPVLGAHPIDLERGQTAADFHTRGRWAKLGASLFAECSNGLTRPRPRVPFLFSPAELRAFASWDVRFGGFGPLFSGALLVSLPLLAVLLRRGAPHRAPALVLLAAVAGMVAINPEAWWARLAPQTWLVPAGTALLGSLSTSRNVRRIASGLLVLLLANLALVSVPYLFGQAVFTASARSQLAGLREAARREGPLLVRLNSFEGSRWRLEESRIPFREVESFEGRAAVVLAFSQAEVASPSGSPLPEAGTAARIAARALAAFGVNGSAIGLGPP